MDPEHEQRDQHQQEQQQRSRVALGFVGGLLGLSLILGLLGWRNFHQASDHLEAVKAKLHRQGRQLDAQGCIGAVLAWRKRCQVTKSLCDAFAPRAMRTCLAARDRSAYCRTLTNLPGTTHFGYKDCKRRGVTRKTKKACAGSYRMLEAWCRDLNQRNKQARESRTEGPPARARPSAKTLASCYLRADQRP